MEDQDIQKLTSDATQEQLLFNSNGLRREAWKTSFELEAGFHQDAVPSVGRHNLAVLLTPNYMSVGAIS